MCTLEHIIAIIGWGGGCGVLIPDINSLEAFGKLFELILTALRLLHYRTPLP